MKIETSGKVKSFILGIVSSLLITSGVAYAAGKIKRSKLNAAINEAYDEAYNSCAWYDQFELRSSCLDGVSSFAQLLRQKINQR